MSAEARMPKGEWKSVELGDVAEFVRGINFKPDDVVPTGTPGSVACMRTKNVQAELDLSDVWSVGEQFVRREDQFLQAGDILVSSANSWNLVGKCCWIPELPGRASFGGFVSVLRPHRAKVEPRFLFRWFSSDRIQTTLRSFGQQTTNISNLNTDRCLKLPLPLPPLAEQRRIAEVLDRAEALRAKRRAALAQLDSLTQALFLEMFGDPATNPKNWPKTTLGEIIEFVGGSQPPREVFTYEPSPDTIRLVQIRDFKSDEYKTYIPRRLARRFFDEDDVMIGRYGPPVFQILRGLSGSYNVALIKASPNGDISREFIFHLLQEPRLHSYVVARSERTAGQTGVNLELLEKYPAYLPPLPLQREFARRVTAVEALKTSHRASLTELDTLFASLQHRAFLGEL